MVLNSGHLCLINSFYIRLQFRCLNCNFCLKFSFQNNHFHLLLFTICYDFMKVFEAKIKRVKYWTPSFKEGEERPLGRDITHVLRPPDLTTTPKAGLLSFLIP